MAEYLTPVDVGNRALQHCGVPRITSFTDDAKGASEVAFSYDKVRTAELRRNVWRYAVRKVALRAVDNNTMFLVPAAYEAANTYPLGSIVIWENTIYFATTAVPINTPPDANPALWTVYFGPLAVVPWAPGADANAPALWNISQSYPQGALVTTSDGTIWQSITNNNIGHNPVLTAGTQWESVGSVNTSTGYYTGELVYILSGTTVSVFMSLQTGNVDDPTAIEAWSATQTYFMGETVTYASAVWQSVNDLNLNNTPGASAEWEAVPATQSSVMAGQNWLELDATIVHQKITYPIQAGPRNQSTTRNVFRLPSGYLREAPQDPKQGIASYLGAPSGLPYDDWVLEGDWLISRDESVIIFRFVADVADVTLMDPMFCEGFAARLALEVCEPLTQSDAKLNTISQIYKTWMGDARAVNGIETGSVEPPIDDYITARL